MTCWKTSLILIIGFLGWNLGYSQVPRDSSYTIQSTYLKHLKKYPEVSIPEIYPSKKTSIIKDTTYRILAGRDLLADLYFPSKVKNLKPGILMVHGGGWRAGDKSLMESMAIRFSENGYVVMVPEYRMSLEAAYPAAVYDLKAALRWLKVNSAQFGLDVNRVAILGCSAGGQLASLVGVTGGTKVFFEDGTEKDENQVQAIIDIDGVLKFRHPDSSEGKMAADWLGGIYEQVPENWEEASPLNFVDKNTPPTLFLASKNPRFLAGHREFMSLLDSYGVRNQKIELGDAPHSFWLLNPWFEPTTKYVLDFLNEVFKN